MTLRHHTHRVDGLTQAAVKNGLAIKRGAELAGRDREWSRIRKAGGDRAAPTFTRGSCGSAAPTLDLLQVPRDLR